MGDFNFRMRESTQFLTADYVDLSSRCERTLNVSKLGCLKDFKEGEIKFKPTYKLEIGKDLYNSSRTKSWTDRILFKSDDSS